MARVYGIKKRLTEYNTDEKLIKKIISNGDLVDIITRMEKLLDPEITYQILDSCACIGEKDLYKRSAKYNKEMADDTLKGKISQLGNLHSDFENVTLNDDNTLTAVMYIKDDGKYKCVCPATVKKDIKVGDLSSETSDDRVMPLSYCFCCAGYFRRYLQIALDLKLKTKEIVSSPANSKGEKPCEFIFEII